MRRTVGPLPNLTFSTGGLQLHPNRLLPLPSHEHNNKVLSVFTRIHLVAKTDSGLKIRKKKAFSSIAWGDSVQQQKTVTLLSPWLCPNIKESEVHFTWLEEAQGQQELIHSVYVRVGGLTANSSQAGKINEKYSVCNWLQGEPYSYVSEAKVPVWTSPLPCWATRGRNGQN